MQHLQKTGGGRVLWLTSFSCQNRRSFFSSPPFPREKQSLSFHALTNCSFHKPFVLTFMHRMGGVGGPPNIQTCQHSNLVSIFISHRPDRKNHPLAPPDKR